MKKIIPIILTLLLSATLSHAQTGRNSVEATEIELVRTGELVTVTFTLEAGKKAARSGYSLIVNPVITKGRNAVQLPAVVVQGRRANVTALRHELATGQRTYQQEPQYVRTGGSVHYKTTLPYESWMTGAQLVLEGVSVGCCSSTETTIGLIANNILYAKPETDIRIVEVPVVLPRISVGDRLTEQYAFVAPVAEFERARKSEEGMFDYDMPLNLGKGTSAPRQNEVERFINETREGSISIYFRQGRRDIDRSYMSNNKLLVELISVVRAIVASGDTKVTRIVIAGFASPEGSTELNDRLAWDRAVAVKSFLTANSGIDPQVIHIYNGSVDWTGLRTMVAESDMYQKYRIMEIIDNTPVWDSHRKTGRHGELMRLDGGQPYRYMSREFFPQLRQAAYIKVYYETTNE